MSAEETKSEDGRWQDVGSVDQLAQRALQVVKVDRTSLALSYVDGRFAVVSGVCNHVGGPLGEGRLEGDYIVCPWHKWKFHRETGKGEPGYEEDAVPAYDTKVEGGRVLVYTVPRTKRTKKKHEPHPLTQIRLRGTAGGPDKDAPIRVLGISTTNMDPANPRYSTSDALLDVAMQAATKLGAEARAIRLHELTFRACEGYYSRSAHACTWPCSITQMDPDDQMDRVYEGFVQWADVILVATPIRWGGASSLYYKMIERMNCIQNQITIANRILLRNKVAAFIVTGGQDNVQAVVGQMMTFFSELGCVFPQFPFIAHSRGWSAEDMERNVAYVAKSRDLVAGAEALVNRSIETARALQCSEQPQDRIPRGGRKAHQLDTKAQS
jgi:nitrite reductase/ring-hydroxylating ferredoxin subunit/multimeric flavodoxin WrbA